MKKVLNKNKILEIYKLLEVCPRTRAALPCDLQNFKKLVLLMDKDKLEELYAALIFESNL